MGQTHDEPAAWSAQGSSTGGADQVVVDLVVVEQVGRRAGFGPVLLGAGDPDPGAVAGL
jgi:hypothetical protein